MAATYKDIQRETGLSLATISKYFNGGSMRENNRQAVEAAIGKLNFRVNEFARSLKSKRSHSIGVLIPELTGTFHASIIADVEDILRMHGYGTIICDFRLDRQVEREALIFLLDKMVDGILIVPLDKSGTQLLPATERGVPVVLIDRLTDAFVSDAVVTDNESAGELAVAEFVLHGHRRIAMLGGPQGVYTMRRRVAGFKAALAARGLVQEEELIQSGDMTVAGGYEGVKKLLALSKPPEALFCANYEITLGTVIALNEQGVRIGKDISLVGFDNLTLSRLVSPRLTIIMQPMRQIAENAARLMLKRLGDVQADTAPQTVMLPLTLVQGESVSDLTGNNTVNIP